jgi:uncharacterized membrane protein
MSFLSRYKFWIVAPLVVIAVAIGALVLLGDGGSRLYPQF